MRAHTCTCTHPIRRHTLQIIFDIFLYSLLPPDVLPFSTLGAFSTLETTVSLSPLRLSGLICIVLTWLIYRPHGIPPQSGSFELSAKRVRGFLGLFAVVFLCSASDRCSHPDPSGSRLLFCSVLAGFPFLLHRAHFLGSMISLSPPPLSNYTLLLHLSPLPTTLSLLTSRDPSLPP